MVGNKGQDFQNLGYIIFFFVKVYYQCLQNSVITMKALTKT